MRITDAHNLLGHYLYRATISKVISLEFSCWGVFLLCPEGLPGEGTESDERGEN